MHHRALAAFALLAGLRCGVPAASAAQPPLVATKAAPCSPVFRRGQVLPEPAAQPRVTQIYELRRREAAGATLRLGYVYIAAGGATYYLAETEAATPAEIEAETAWLRAAGISRTLAAQYTHLSDVPAVPPIPHALALGRRFHDQIVTCP